MAFNLNDMGDGQEEQPMSEINVTPFVDVMLVLLIIFMVTAPMLTAGVNVDLPQTSASGLEGKDEPLSVSIDKAGNIYLQETKIQLTELVVRLNAITKENKQVRIFVRGDRTVDYGRIMLVVGEINNAGFAKVSLVTESLHKGQK
jgi:biopolymer transport protein TolR